MSEQRITTETRVAEMIRKEVHEISGVDPDAIEVFVTRRRSGHSGETYDRLWVEFYGLRFACTFALQHVGEPRKAGLVPVLTLMGKGNRTVS